MATEKLRAIIAAVLVDNGGGADASWNCLSSDAGKQLDDLREWGRVIRSCIALKRSARGSGVSKRSAERRRQNMSGVQHVSVAAARGPKSIHTYLLPVLCSTLGTRGAALGRRSGGVIDHSAHCPRHSGGIGCAARRAMREGAEYRRAPDGQYVAAGRRHSGRRGASVHQSVSVPAARRGVSGRLGRQIAGLSAQEGPTRCRASLTVPYKACVRDEPQINEHCVTAPATRRCFFHHSCLTIFPPTNKVPACFDPFNPSL
jgi:hypothetical protein